MTEGLVPAYLAHVLPGRLRIRVPDRQGNESYFADLRERLAGRREIAAISVNAATAGILLHLAPEAGIADIADAGRALSLFDFDPSAKAPAHPVGGRSVLAAASAGFKAADRLLADGTGGYLDVRSSIFLALLAVSARQLVRGQFIAPGLTVLLQALNMITE